MYIPDVYSLLKLIGVTRLCTLSNLKFYCCVFILHICATALRPGGGDIWQCLQGAVNSVGECELTSSGFKFVIISLRIRGLEVLK